MKIRCYQRALCALCLLCLSACSTSTREWTFWDNANSHPCFNSGKIILEPESSCHHIGLEISRTTSGVRLYINAYLLPIAPLPEDYSRARLEVILEDGEVMTFYPYRLQGGQRLLLPSEAANFLIELLLEGQGFTIKAGRNEIGVIPDRFDELYQKLMDLPIATEI